MTEPALFRSSAAPPTTSSSPRVTLIVLLYNAEDHVQGLVDAALGQRHPAFPEQEQWLRILFMDDCSRDRTVERLHTCLQAAGIPSHVTVIANERNIGLAATYNKAFAAITTPYGLTCHLDVVFGSAEYVAGMLALMEEHPEAGAITGQPCIPPDGHIPLPEKLNVICNLMDIFPAEVDDAVIPVGFAEGRCDIFRVEALCRAGFWDTTLRASGEDQILAARMRQLGYQVYQAPRLPYYLSVSDEQNSVRKLLRHAHLFGRTQPYILAASRDALSSSGGSDSGANRQARKLLRGSHIFGVCTYLFSLVLLSASRSPNAVAIVLLLLGMLAALKTRLLFRHARAVGLNFRELIILLAFVPLQDVYYTVGLVQGVWNCMRGRSGKVIR